MPTNRQIREFIESSRLSDIKKRALLARLNGISSYDDEQIEDGHLRQIFEGVQELFDHFSQSANNS